MPDAFCCIYEENIPDLNCAHSPIAALIEIKTAVSKISLQTALLSSSLDIHFVDIGVPDFNDLFHVEHQFEVLRQDICSSLTSEIYFLASESHMLLTIFNILPSSLGDVRTYFLTT